MSWQPPGGYPPQGGPPGYPPPAGYPAPPYGAAPVMYMPPTPGPAPGLAFAGFWRRTGGYLLDALIIAVPVLILFFVLFWSDITTYINNASTSHRAAAGTITAILPTGALIAYTLVGAAINYLYYGFLVHSWGRTVGQAAVGVRVVPMEDLSGRLPLSRSTMRSAVFWGPGLVGFVPVIGQLVAFLPLISFIFVAFDAQKQGLHDKLGHAFVVRPDPTAMPLMPAGAWGPPPGGPPPGWPPPQLPGPGGGPAVP
jgi:uncharacterized RDD family membrane protein YckC